MPEIIRIADESFEFYRRDEWGSRKVTAPGDNDGRPEPKGYLHQEGGAIASGTWTVAQEKQKMRDLQAYCIDGAGQGWSDIPYNICVMPSGRVYEGRGWRSMSGATADENTESKAVLMLGNFDKQSTFAPQINSAALCFAWGTVLGELERIPLVLGHRENPDHLNATSCPGRNVDMSSFRALVGSKIAKLMAPPPQPQPPAAGGSTMLVVCTDTPMWPGIGAVYQLANNGAQRITAEFYPVLVAAGYAPSDTLKLPKMAWDQIAAFV